MNAAFGNLRFQMPMKDSIVYDPRKGGKERETDESMSVRDPVGIYIYTYIGRKRSNLLFVELGNKQKT